MSEVEEKAARASPLRTAVLRCAAVWPHLTLWTGAGVAFWFMVVPSTIRQETRWLPTFTPGQRAALLIFFLMIGIVAGWRICFGGRSYSRGRYLRYLVQSVFLAPVLFGFLIFFLLAYVPQMREIYLSIIEERRWGEGAIGLVSLLLLCALLGAWQRGVGNRLLSGLYSDHADLTFDRGLNRVLTFKGNVSSILPLTGLLAGLAGLAVDADVQIQRLGTVDKLLGGDTLSGGLDKIVEAMQRLTWGLPIAAVISAVVVAGVMRVLRYVSTTGGGIGMRSIFLVCGILTVGMVLLPPLSPMHTIAVARAVGPLTMVLWALIAIVSFFTFMSWLSVRVRLPVTAIFLTCVFAVLLVPSMFGAEPETEETRRTPFRSAERGQLEDTFKAWLAARPDKARYISAKRPYPVFIFAAAGGGIYAASAAATFLAELQDDCASFSRHVFMISGVSGGAVGSSLFNALANAQSGDGVGCARSRSSLLADHTEQIIRSDHLSPVVAVLISDTLRKLVIGGQSVAGDRAELLQLGFAATFADGVSCRTRLPDVDCQPMRSEYGLSLPFEKHWSLTSRGPALLLNTTWSETGYRVAFAPFPLNPSSEGTLFNFNEIARAAQIQRTLIEAAVVSARFPGIVPAWGIDPGVSEKPRRWNFVDGGYVDNSGSTSAMEIYEAISNIDNLPFEIDLRLVLLTDSETALVLSDVHGTAYSDTVAPIKALLKVRSQLADRAVAQAIRRVAPGRSRSSLSARDRENDSKIWLVSLEQGAFPLPLGWKISRLTNNIVGYMLGRPDWCQELPKVESQPREVRQALTAVVENSCVKDRILKLIRTPEEEATPAPVQGPGGRSP